MSEHHIRGPERGIVPEELDPKTEYYINTEHSILPAEEVAAKCNLEASAVARITVVSQKMLILDTRESSEIEDSFTLVTEDWRKANGNPYVGVLPLARDTLNIIGREHNTDVLPHNSYTSHSHYSIFYSEDDRIVVTDLESSNGTSLQDNITNRSTYERVRTRDDYASMVDQRLSHDSKYDESIDEEAPYGRYNGHPLIGRKIESMENGIYDCITEKILMDTDSQEVQEAVKSFLTKIEDVIDEGRILEIARDEVAEVLRYDLSAVETLVEDHKHPDGIIKISEFLSQGFGVCRHQAPLTAYLLEIAIQNDRIAGTPGVERNIDNLRSGGHAWAVLHKEDGSDIIVDATQGYVGERSDSPKRGGWIYRINNVDRDEKPSAPDEEPEQHEEKDEDDSSGESQPAPKPSKEEENEDENHEEEQGPSVNKLSKLGSLGLALYLKAQNTSLNIIENVQKRYRDKEKKEQALARLALGVVVGGGLAAIGYVAYKANVHFDLAEQYPNMPTPATAEPSLEALDITPSSAESRPPTEQPTVETSASPSVESSIPDPSPSPSEAPSNPPSQGEQDPGSDDSGTSEEDNPSEEESGNEGDSDPDGANELTPNEILEEHSPHGIEGRHIPTNAGAYEVFNRLGLGDQWEELYSDIQLRDQLVKEGSAYSLSDLPITHSDHQEHGFGWLTDSLTDESIEAIYERAEELNGDSTPAESGSETTPSDTETVAEDATNKLEALSEQSAESIESFDIALADGGEALVENISKELWPNGNTSIDTEVWYRIENDLLAEHPRDFYRMNDGHVGIVRPGYMSEGAKDTVIAAINNAGFTLR